MLRLATSLTAIFCLVLSGTAAFAQSHLTAHLTGAQERPAVASAAQGTAVFTLTGDDLHYFVTVEGLTGPITGSHIHTGKRGVNGGVAHDIAADFLGGGITSAHGTWENLTTAQITDLLAGNLYINIHTAANPGGEIRGQIDVGGGTHLTANLNAAQENPGTGAAALGTASLTLTEEGLEYKITVNALTGGITAAHIHGAEIGVNGGVVFDLGGSFSGTTAEGIWRRGAGAGELTNALLRDLLLGRQYLNVHTAANPGGEIRGQIILASGFGGRARIDQAQEVPPTGAAGQGTATFTLTPSGLVYNITVEGLTGAIAAAHIHRAPAGVNGGVVKTLTADFVGGTARGVWRSDDAEPLTNDLICRLFEQGLYVNIHTAANPAGEIRGQIMLNTGSTSLAATLSSNQEEPTNPSTARGVATARLSGTTLDYDVSAQGLTGPITAAHFHNAPIGVNGGATFNILAAFGGGNTAHGSIAGLTAAQVNDFLKGNFYVNIHTAANPGGEIRGQVLLASGLGMRFPLTDDQEVPATGVAALGTGSATLTNDGLVYAITVSGLASAFASAHFHNEATGVNGGVVRAFTGGFVSNHIEDVWHPADASPLTPALRRELVLGRIYANIHTVGNPGGEIRGQVNPADGFATEDPLVGGAEVPPVATLGFGTAGTTLSEEGVIYNLSFANLSSPFTASHFHSAPAGVNGGVVHDISGSVTAGTGRGIWLRSAGLTDALICDYFEGELYINVHTTIHGGGEIRSNLNDLIPSDAPLLPFASGLQLRTSPNPTHGYASIAYELPQATHVALRVYDAQGAVVRIVADEAQDAGSHEVELDGTRWPSGVYFVRLQTDLGTDTRKLVLIGN